MASGGQYVTRTGQTVMPASYADSLDWGEDMFLTTIHMWRRLVRTAMNSLLTKLLKHPQNFHFCCSFSLQYR